MRLQLILIFKSQRALPVTAEQTRCGRSAMPLLYTLPARHFYEDHQAALRHHPFITRPHHHYPIRRAYTSQSPGNTWLIVLQLRRQLEHYRYGLINIEFFVSGPPIHSRT